jgi:hypothetical protein
MQLSARMAVCRYAADVYSFPLLQGAPVPSNEEFRVQVLRSYNILDTVREPLCKEVPCFSAGPSASYCVHIGKSKTSCKPVASLCGQLRSGSTSALNLEGGTFPSEVNIPGIAEGYVKSMGCAVKASEFKDTHKSSNMVCAAIS